MTWAIRSVNIAGPREQGPRPGGGHRVLTTHAAYPVVRRKSRHVPSSAMSTTAPRSTPDP